MKSISLPNKVSFEKSAGNKAVVVIEPLYPGYGVTIGNSLRRVLLSSLPGAAVTAVKIKGVDHEFSTIENVREDVLDIVLNLKLLRLKVFSDEPVRLRLQSKGEKEVTAADIEPNADVEIINKDLVIGTLDGKESKFDMELIVQQGRGYEPVEMREDEKLEIGMIAVDAVYSPIRNVNYEVQHVRVGQITNYDKLTITMETDGTTTGEEALDQAAEILVAHFSLFKTDRMEELAAPADEDQGALDIDTTKTEAIDEEVSVEKEIPASDLEKLDLSNRAFNALKRNGIVSMEQLKGMTREDLEKLEGLGAKSIDEIMEAINNI